MATRRGKSTCCETRLRMATHNTSSHEQKRVALPTASGSDRFCPMASCRKPNTKLAVVWLVALTEGRVWLAGVGAVWLAGSV